MRKLFNFIFLVPLAIILILLSVANRRTTSLSLDPLNSEAPAVSVELPLFVLLFCSVIVGILIGGAIMWFSQGKHRKALREKSHEVSQLKQDIGKPASSPSTNEVREIAPGLPLISRS